MISAGFKPGFGLSPWFTNMAAQNQDQIAFPERETYATTLPGIQAAIKVPTLAPVQSVPGFDQSYWDKLYKQSQGRLSGQFFGPQDSLQTKMIENLNTRGLLGSGVEQKGFQGLSKSYGEQLADLETNISRQQAEQKLAEAQKVRELQQQRDIQAGEWGMQGTELGLRSALTEAAEANKFGIGKFEQQVKLEDLMRTDSRERQKILSELLSSPNFELPEGDVPGILDAIMGGYSGPSIYGGNIQGGASSYPSSIPSTGSRTSYETGLQKLKKKYSSPVTWPQYPAQSNADFAELLANF